MKAVSIHSHTTYSTGDAFGLPGDHVNRVADLEMFALGLTEHGNISSHVKLEQAATKEGIKPLFGIEAYTAPDDMREKKNTKKWHQTILAMNQRGYLNLNQLVTSSWAEGFYRWPTVTGSMLKRHHEGLIVTSGCSDGLVACSLLGGKGIAPEDASEARANAVIRRYKRLLGDRYYLEAQQFAELERTRNINTWLEEASRRHGVPLVATFDAHYPLPGDNEMQKILHAASRGAGTVAAVEQGWQYDILLTYPTSDADLLKKMMGTGLSKKAAQQSIEATAEIAGRCNVELPKMERLRYPVSQEPDSSRLNSTGLMRRWLNDGWKYRGCNLLSRLDRKKYIDRIEYELRIFIEKDFVDYFLMLSDLVRRAKDNGLPVGPARGSAAASLVCYLLRITELDPMGYPMVFERFVDPSRSDLPDVDLDFDDERRDEIRQLAIERYGVDCVGNIGTFTQYRGRNSIDDVARVHQLSRVDASSIKDMLIDRPRAQGHDSIRETRESFPAVQEIFKKTPAFYFAERLEGNIKTFGVHAAGLVIGSSPLNDCVASYTRHDVGAQKKTLNVMAVDKYDGEHLGLLKVDALGLTTMGMIRHALEIAGMTLEELYALPFDDPETLQAFEDADVTGIFQFEGNTARIICQEMRPTNFMDLAAINALARPGPLHSGGTAAFLAVRHGGEQADSIHPIVDKITSYTEGQIVYQEQLIQICRELGKFNVVEANKIRKIISQSKGGVAFNELWLRFLEGCLANGASESDARRVWAKMISAGSYAFNIAHAISYSAIGYWCMWLKKHHPLAFYTASLRKTDPNNKDRVLALMHDMQDEWHGRIFKVYPPNRNTSTLNWEPAPDGTGVIAGFTQIKGVGDKMAEAIVSHRNEIGGFSSWDDLLSVKGFGIKKLQTIKDFCNAEDPFGIHWLEDSRTEIIKAIRSGDISDPYTSEALPAPNTYAVGIPFEPKRSFHVVLGVIKDRRISDLFEGHRARTGEDLDPSKVKDPHLKDSMTLFCQDPSGEMTLKVNRWLYPRVKGQLWGATLGKDFILARVVKYPLAGKSVSIEKFWIIDPE